MRVNNKAKEIVVVLMILAVFSSMVVWHDKPSGAFNAQEREVLIQALSLQNADLSKFVAQIKQDDLSAFYSVGIPSGGVWPRNLWRASYVDPLASAWQFKAIRDAYKEEVELVRYRSMNDFLKLLQTEEINTPGYISSLKFNSRVLVKEDVLSLSLRSITAIVLAMLSLFLMGLVTKRA